MTLIWMIFGVAAGELLTTVIKGSKQSENSLTKAKKLACPVLITRRKKIVKLKPKKRVENNVQYE